MRDRFCQSCGRLLSSWESRFCYMCQNRGLADEYLDRWLSPQDDPFVDRSPMQDKIRQMQLEAEMRNMERRSSTRKLIDEFEMKSRLGIWDAPSSLSGTLPSDFGQQLQRQEKMQKYMDKLELENLLRRSSRK